MNQNKVCPICHKENIPEAQVCSHCGQRLKLKELKKREYKNYLKKHSSKNKSIYESMFFILILIITIIPFLKGQAISVMHEKIPPKIVMVNDMNTYINQNDSFRLPDKIGAKMNYGENKAVVVNWDTKEVDSSTAGTKIINGKVNEYNEVVCFKVIVLPKQVQESLDMYIVENSILELNIKLSEDIKWVFFRICKGTESRDQVIHVNNGLVNCKVYLPFDSGNYRIKVHTSISDNRKDPYYELKSIKVKNEDTRDMSFLMPDINIQSDSEQIRNLAYKITEDCISDMEKTRAIHDWVSSNIAYDVEAINNNTVHEYSAIETLEGKKAICNGYANLTAALNRSIGIRCKIVSGVAESSIIDKLSKNNLHAWNETYIDGEWVMQDTTWDAGGVDKLTNKFKFNLSHRYFNPTSRVFEINHKKLDER